MKTLVMIVLLVAAGLLAGMVLSLCMMAGNKDTEHTPLSPLKRGMEPGGVMSTDTQPPDFAKKLRRDKGASR